MSFETRFTHRIYDNSPVWMQDLFVSIAGYSERRKRFGSQFWQFLSFLEESKRFSAEETKEYQRQELQRLLRHAYDTVPHYRRVFDERKLTPQDIRGVENLHELPFLTKEDLSLDLGSLTSAVVSRRDLVPVHTSGTTGSAIKFFWTKEGLAKEFAFVWARRRDGSALGDLHATFNARNVVPVIQSGPPFWRSNRAVNQVLFSHYHISGENMTAYLEELAGRPFAYYEGYPSALYLLADFALAEGFHMDNHPKAVYTSSETLLGWQRDAIEKAFQTRVDDSYGTAEQSALATQCSSGNYHFVPEYGIVELLPVEEDEEYVKAEIVATSFLNYVHPMIRYRQNDYVLIPKSQECPCEQGGTVIKQIDGRIEDIIVTPEGNMIGRLDHIFKDLTNIKESQVVQCAIDAVTVKVVRREVYDKKDEEALVYELRSRLGPRIRIDIEYVDNIPRSASGKFRAVLSQLTPERRRVHQTATSKLPYGRGRSG